MKKGQDVIDKPVYTEWSKKLDDARSQISAGLTNDMQRQEFQRRADATTVQFQEGLGHHVAQQTDVAYKQNYDGRKEVETRSAIQNWNNPAAVEASLLRVKDGVDMMAEHFRWPQSLRDGALLMDQGAINKEIVQTAIANGDYEYAQKWATDHQDNMDLRTRKYLETALREGKQKEVFNAFTSDYLANMKDPHYLETLLTKVQKDPVLDDSRVNMLTYRIQRQQDTLQKASDAQAARYKAQVMGGINEVMSVIQSGYPPSQDQMQKVVDQAGYDQETKAAASEMVRHATAVRAFSQQTPVEQERFLAGAEANARSDPMKYDIKLLNSMRNISTSQRNEVKADPVDFAVRQGIEQPSTVDASKITDMGPVLRERYALINNMKGTHNAPEKPLTEAEAAHLGMLLKNATPAVKTKFYGDLSAASGSDDIGRAGYSWVMGQLAKDDPVTAVAGEYMGKKRQIAAFDMIAGQAILHPVRSTDGSPDHSKLWPMPPEKDMDLAADDYIGTAMAGKPQAANAIHQAAKAIYAKRISDIGDRTGILNTDVWESAMKAATGGVETYHGEKLLMPYGMAKSEFKDQLALRVQGLAPDVPWLPGKAAPAPAAAQPHGGLSPKITRDVLLGLPLEPMKDGTYGFRTGTKLLTYKDGTPITVDFEQPALHQREPAYQNPATSPSTAGPRPTEDVR